MDQDPSIIAVVCSTYYPSWYQGSLRSIHHTDKIRGDLALEFIETSLQNGYWVVVTDGFSTKTFQKKLTSFTYEKLIILKRKNKLAKSFARKQAFYRGMKIPNVKVIVYSEPEKVSLIEHIPELIKPILSNHCEIVIPSRDDSVFKSTYPDFQYQSEKEGNYLYNHYLQFHNITNDKQFDFFFGPRVYNVDQKIKSLFQTPFSLHIKKLGLPDGLIDIENLSDYLFFPIVLALKRKLRVESITIPFRYPLLQKQNEEIGQRKLFEEKRRSQRLTLVLELMLFLDYLEHKK